MSEVIHRRINDMIETRDSLDYTAKALYILQGELELPYDKFDTILVQKRRAHMKGQLTKKINQLRKNLVLLNKEDDIK